MFSNQIFGTALIGQYLALPLAFSILILSLRGFFKIGGNTITPMSMIFLAIAVNLGFGAVFRVIGGTINNYDLAVMLGLLFFVIVLLLVKEKFPQNPELNFLKTKNGLRPRMFGVAAICIYVIYFMLYRYDMTLELLWVAVLGLLPALFFIGAIYALKNRYRIFFFFLSVTCFFSILVYYNIVFSGGARINFVATLLGVFIIASWVWPSRLYKTLILFSFPFAMTWASVIEVTRYTNKAQVFNIEAFVRSLSSGEGLTSILAPYDNLVRIVSMSEIWGMRPLLEWFDQVIFTFFFWVPRLWWPNKPEGFGTIIVYELEPDLLSINHSMATSFLGEFVFYAGMFAPVLALVVVTIFVFFLNKLLNLVGRTSSSVWMVNYALLAFMSAQSLTLIWGGLASYAPRGFAALLGLCPMIFLWLFLRPYQLRARI